MYEQEIIEKKTASPLATALLVVSAVCLLGAMILQGIQIKRYTVSGADGSVSSANTWQKKSSAAVGKKSKAVLDDAYPSARSR